MVPIVHNTHWSGVSHDLTIVSDYVSSSGQWAIDCIRMSAVVWPHLISSGLKVCSAISPDNLTRAWHNHVMGKRQIKMRLLKIYLFNVTISYGE